MMRKRRRELRTSMLIKLDQGADNQTQADAFIWSNSLDTSIKGKYSIWRRDFDNPNSDSTLKLMRDQIIMGKAYANIAKSSNSTVHYNSLMKHLRESQRAIGEAQSDADLDPRYAPPLSLSCILIYGFHAWIFCSILSPPVFLFKQKQWATLSLKQRINCMNVLQFQGS